MNKGEFHPFKLGSGYPLEGNPLRAAAIIREIAETCGQALK